MDLLVAVYQATVKRWPLAFVRATDNNRNRGSAFDASFNIFPFHQIQKRKCWTMVGWTSPAFHLVRRLMRARTMYASMRCEVSRHLFVGRLLVPLFPCCIIFENNKLIDTVHRPLENHSGKFSSARCTPNSYGKPSIDEWIPFYVIPYVRFRIL